MAYQPFPFATAVPTPARFGALWKSSLDNNTVLPNQGLRMSAIKRPWVVKGLPWLDRSFTYSVAETMRSFAGKTAVLNAVILRYARLSAVSPMTKFGLVLLLATPMFDPCRDSANQPSWRALLSRLIVLVCNV